MKLASHNTFTYFKPKKWWAKLINWTAKCQKKTLQEQYEEYGARLFDLRVWYDKNLNIMFPHGIVDYKVSAEEIHSLLQYLNDKGDCVVRVILEENNSRKKKSYAERNENLFASFCDTLEKTYTGIQFFGGLRKWDWKILYEFKMNYPDIREYNKSGLWPWWGAFWGNKKNMKNHTNEEQWAMFDFLNIR